MKSHEIGVKIRELREARKLSQAKLAGLSGVDPNQLARVERGESEPSVAWTEKVAAGLSVGFVLEFVDTAQGGIPAAWVDEVDRIASLEKLHPRVLAALRDMRFSRAHSIRKVEEIVAAVKAARVELEDQFLPKKPRKPTN